MKLGDVTSNAVGKQLAVLVDGQVFNAPHVATTTPAEATQVAAALHATATS